MFQGLEKLMQEVQIVRQFPLTDKIANYHPNVNVGVGVAPTFDLANAFANIGAKFAEQNPGSQHFRFQYDILLPILQLLEELRKQHIYVIKEATFVNGSKEITLNTSLNGLDMNPKIFDLLRQDYVAKEDDAVAGDCARYYENLNHFDTFKSTSVIREWRNQRNHASRSIEMYLEGKTDRLPFIDMRSMFYYDAKSWRFLSRARFDYDIINSSDRMYLVFFDAVGLNNLNRIAMEKASKKLLEIFKDGIDEQSIAAANKVIPNILRQVDIFMHKYNNQLRDILLEELGLTDDAKLLGNIQGDETKFAIKKEYLARVGVKNEKDFAEFIDKKIKGRINLSLYGQKLEFRSAVSLIDKSRPLGQIEMHDNSNNAEIYIDALEHTDNLMKEAKEAEKGGDSSRNTRFGKLIHTPFRYRDITGSQTYKNYLMIDTYDTLETIAGNLQSVADMDVDETSSHLRRKLKELYNTFSDTMALPRKKGGYYNVARVIWAGNKNEGVGDQYVSRRTANGMKGVGDYGVNILRDKIYRHFISFFDALKLVDKRSGNLTFVG